MTAPSKPAGTPIPREKPDEGGDGASPRTPQTPDQPGQSIDRSGGAAGTGVPEEELERLRALAASQDGVIRELHQRNREQDRRLKEFDTRIKGIETPPTPKPSDEEMDERFWKQPGKSMREMIREELQATVKPLNEEISRLRGASVYDQMKEKLKGEYSDIWGQIEPGIDDFIRNATAQGNELNQDLVNIAALTMSGALYRGQLRDPATGQPIKPSAPRDGSPTPPAAEEERKVTTPAHLRPSAPKIPGREPPAKETRELSENERRLARERGWTDAQYLDWLDVPPEQVVHSDIGRKK